MFLRRNSCELIDVRAAGAQESADGGATFSRDHIATSVRALPDQSVRAQQKDAAADGSGPGPRHLCRSRRRAIKQLAYFMIAEPINGKLAAIDVLQQPGVGRSQRIKGAVTPSPTPNGFAGFFGPGKKRNGAAGGGQSLEVAFVGGPAYLCPALHLRDAAWQLAPTFSGAWTGPQGRAIDLELAGAAHCRLHAQDASLFVVKLDRIPVQAVLDADPLGPALEVTNHLAVELPGDITGQWDTP